MKKVVSLVLVALMMLFVFSGCNSSDYKEAVALMEQGNYKEAITLFEGLGDYKDSAAKKAEAEKILDIIKALESGVWYFEAETKNSVNRLLFADGTAAVSLAYMDGNGRHESSDVTNYTYKITDAEIILIKDDLSETAISYTFKNDTLTLDKSKYFTPEMVDEGVQGYWTSKSSQSVLGEWLTSEHNIYFNEGKVVSESATEAYGYNDGTYYYYGPYEGTYEIGFGNFETEIRHGDDWFFRIEDGKVQILHYDNLCSESDGLPGEDGYEL